VDEPVVEELLEEAAHVEGEDGSEHVERRVAREVRVPEDAVGGAGGEEEAHEEADGPAIPADAEPGRRAAFHEQHVGPGEREAAQAKDEAPEDEAVGERVPGDRQGEDTEGRRQEPDSERCHGVSCRVPAKAEELPPASECRQPHGPGR